MPLSERAQQLIPLARIVSFEGGKSRYNEEIIAIFQQADDEGRYLSDRDLEILKQKAPNLAESLEYARLIRDKAQIIVDNARNKVLMKYPTITEEGGDLYPPERAVACWRDFWHFLRCITYGIAGQMLPFTSSVGLQNMELLYQELGVPLGAMVFGLESLKSCTLEQVYPEETPNLSPYFEHLITALQQFKSDRE